MLPPYTSFEIHFLTKRKGEQLLPDRNYGQEKPVGDLFVDGCTFGSGSLFNFVLHLYRVNII